MSDTGTNLVQSYSRDTRVHFAHMRSRYPRPLSEHRLTRLLVWFAMILGWFALGAPHERRQRRFGFVSKAALCRAVRNLIIIRAAALLRPRQQTPWRSYAPNGFLRRRNRCSLRAIGGVWLRKRLSARGGLVAQAKHLIEMLRQFSALAAKLAYRRRRGLSRLSPLVLTHAPELHAANQCAASPVLADSS